MKRMNRKGEITKCRTQIAAVLIVVLVGLAQAGTITVGSDPNCDFDTIQAGINAAIGGDVVIVADGVYTGDGNRDIDFGGKNITVRGKNGPENCIIDCQGTEAELHRGFYFHSGEGPNSVLDGFTITNGCAYKGGAIYCRYSSSPTITNCIIRGNISPYYYVPDPFHPMVILQDGGGIYCSESSPIIKNCHFLENIATGGGGAIYSYRGNSIVRNCVISGNQAGISGGAIGLYEDNMYIHNCVITGNRVGFLLHGIGGGISCSKSTSTVTNCTITGNSAKYYGGGISAGGIVLTNCILWGNTHEEIYGSPLITYSDIQDGWPGTGNVDVDPCFVSPGYWADANDPDIIVEPNDPNAIWIEGDYHLYPFSLCINAGDPNYLPEPNETDLDGNSRIIAGRIDMGAYESNHIEARLYILPRTINRHSRQKRVWAWLRLPKGITKDDIDSNTPLLLYPGQIEPTHQYIFPRGRRGPKRVSIIAYFDKRDLMDVISDNGRMELKLVGRLKTGRYFYGTDTVRIINRRPPAQR